jgi:outer membrane protein, multidrug efflux system
MKHLTNRLFLLLAVLSACRVSKDITMPEAVLPGSFRNAAAAIDTTTIAEMQWENFFGDTVLRKLIDHAIARNYDMQIALKNIAASGLLLKQVKWNYLPEGGLQVTASTSDPSKNSLDGLSLSLFNLGTHIEYYSVGPELSWEADIWGRIKNQGKSALAAYLQTIEAKKAIQTNIIASVAQGYYNLLMLDASLAIAQKNVLLNDSTLQIIRLQYEVGQVSVLAVQQAQAQELAARQLIAGFEQNSAIQENALSILTGELPGKIDRNSTLGGIPLPENLSAGLPSAMLSRRPDVKSLELALLAANAQVGIAKADMYPALRITANGGVNSYLASTWFNIPASLFGLVAGSIAQPLLEHHRLKTRYQVAKLDRERTVLQFRQSVLNAVGESSDALVKIEKLKTQQGIAANRVNTLAQATANAGQLFKNGKASYLEVITAQGSALQSELELASVKRDELNAVTELYRSLGGGWK